MKKQRQGEIIPFVIRVHSRDSRASSSSNGVAPDVAGRRQTAAVKATAWNELITSSGPFSMKKHS